MPLKPPRAASPMVHSEPAVWAMNVSATSVETSVMIVT